MIIAINGKIGAGKDTVAKIIQYLTSDSANIMSYDDYQTSQSKYRYDSDWQIKKFANKLKDIVCLLIGCTREQLEDQEFKNKELGKEWRVHYNWHYKLKRNSNLGRAGDLYFTRDESDNEMASVTYNGLEHGTYVLTPRLLLQLLGTDCGRNIIHPNIWINVTMKDYNKEPYFNKGQPDYDWANSKSEPKPNYPKWIISDMRFKNEFEVVKKHKGISIQINRNDYELVSIGEQTIKLPIEEHQSETDLDDAEFDYYIYNDGTIDELVRKVKIILEQANIIQ